MRTFHHILATSAICIAQSGLAQSTKFPFTKYRMGDFGPDNVSQTAMADFDRDGDLDFASGKRFGNTGEVKMVWWEYQAPDRWVRHDVGGDQKSNASGAALDVDRDGWIDLISGDSWFRNPRNPRDTRWVRHGIGGTTSTGVEGLGAEEMILADLDGDGRMELVSAHKGWASSLWHRIPADPTGPWEEHAFGEATNQGLSAGDFDKDGHLDLVNGQAWYANANGKGLELVRKPLIPFPVANLQNPGDSPLTHSGDIDGDGDMDVALCSHFGPDVVWAENADGKGSRWVRHDVASGKNSIHSIHLADFDFDGDLDIYAGENAGKAWLFENADGKGRYAEHVLLAASFGHQSQVGDVDGDGDLDIVGKPWDGGTHVYMRNLWVENGGKIPTRIAWPRKGADRAARMSLSPSAGRSFDFLGRTAALPRNLSHAPFRSGTPVLLLGQANAQLPIQPLAAEAK